MKTILIIPVMLLVCYTIVWGQWDSTFDYSLPADVAKVNLIKKILSEPRWLDEIMAEQREAEKGIKKNASTFSGIPHSLSSCYADSTKTTQVRIDFIIFACFKKKNWDDLDIMKTFKGIRIKNDLVTGKNKVMYFDYVELYSDISDYAVQFRWQYYCNAWYFTGVMCRNYKVPSDSPND